MRVRLFADLAEVAGRDEVRVERPTPTAGDAIDDLFDAHPALADRVLDDEGTLRESVNLLVDGEPAEGLDSAVDDAEEIALFPPVTGG